MASGGVEQEEEAPIGELVERLFDQGKGYARAEIGLAKALATAKVETIKLPALLLAAAALFVIAGVVTLCITLALALATLIGPLAGGLVATLIAFGVAGALALVARNKLRPQNSTSKP